MNHREIGCALFGFCLSSSLASFLFSIGNLQTSGWLWTTITVLLTWHVWKIIPERYPNNTLHPNHSETEQERPASPASGAE